MEAKKKKKKAEDEVCVLLGARGGKLPQRGLWGGLYGGGATPAPKDSKAHVGRSARSALQAESLRDENKS